MKKILLVKLLNKNLGDHCVAEATEFFINKSIPFWKKKDIKIIPYSIQSEDYGIIQYVDMVIFAGGGLITYERSNFHIYISEIINICNQYKIPVFFNAVGVEGYDPSDERCIRLKEAINSDCVKAITIRDDFDTFKNNYITNNNIYTAEVFDTAVWIKDVYEREFCAVKTGKIGLGIGRAELFSDYGHDKITRNDVISFWVDVVNELENRGYEWEIFTNGLFVDEKFAKEVLKEIGHGNKADVATEGRQLAKTIASYRGIIATRMHSNIIAYSYGVTSVGMIWNEKLRFWGNKINKPERYVEADELDAGVIINRLEAALSEEVVFPPKNERKRTLKIIKDFLKNERETSVPELDFASEKKLFVQALGDKDFTYSNMNAAGQLCEIVSKGARIVETDISVTADGHIVCVNGWNKPTFNKLMLHDEEQIRALSLDEFKSRRYYGSYETMTFEDFLAEYKQIDESLYPLVILHMHEKDDNTRIKAYEDACNKIKASGISFKKFLVGTKKRADIPRLKQIEGIRILYYIDSENEQLESDLRYLKKEHISRAMLNKKLVNKEVINMLEKNGISIFVDGVSKVDEIKEYICLSDSIRAIGVSDFNYYA